MKKALFASLIILGACKSTETINRFAKSADTGMTEAHLATLNFNQICQFFGPAELRKLTDTSLYAGAQRPEVLCLEFKKADSLTNLISQTLSNYFSMLADVSDKKLIAYNASDLLNSLEIIQTQVYPSFAISDEKISAIRGLLNIILNEPVKWYRYNKLISTMKLSDSVLAGVISAYQFMLDSALAGEINQAIENYTSFVYTPLFLWSVSPVEKVFVNQQYKQFLTNMNKEREKVHMASHMFTLIQKDHHLLAFGKPPAGFAYTDAEINQDIILLNRMVAELIQLNK